MNSVNLIGRLTKNPELKLGEIPICQFTIAHNEYYGKKEHTNYIRIVCFGRMGENAGKYLVKGQEIGVSGRIHTNTYKTSDGVTKYVTDIYASTVQFLGKPKGAPEEMAQVNGISEEPPAQEELSQEMPPAEEIEAEELPVCGAWEPEKLSPVPSQTASE